MILKTSDPEYSDHDQIPAGSRSGPDTLPEIASTPQDDARHPAAAHLQHRQISSFPNCSSRAIFQLQAYLFTSSAGSRIKLRRRLPARVSGSSRLPRRPGRGRKKDKEVMPHGSPSGLKENPRAAQNAGASGPHAERALHPRMRSFTPSLASTITAPPL
ncbi:hypothetical protein NQZ68_013327, partial [Dissostichus eleginoides]